MGSGIHILRAKVRGRVGATINMDIDDMSDCNGSVRNSLRASVIDCSRPWGPTNVWSFMKLCLG